MKFRRIPSAIATPEDFGIAAPGSFTQDAMPTIHTGLRTFNCFFMQGITSIRKHCVSVTSC